jgi:hypothetical protein
MDSENKYLLLISVGPKIAHALLIEGIEPARCDPKLGPVRPCLASARASSEQQRSKVGFPIRRFTDQSLFAAPHDLSQRTTSFIASQRQGIHQIPLRHLIALIAKARIRKSDIRSRKSEVRSRNANIPISGFSFLFSDFRRRRRPWR